MDFIVTWLASIVVKLSTRPEKRVGADALWDEAEADIPRCWTRSRPSGGAIETSTAERGCRPKLPIRDRHESWQCGTTQVNLSSGSVWRFLVDTDGDKKTPVDSGDLRLDEDVSPHPGKYRRSSAVMVGAR